MFARSATSVDAVTWCIDHVWLMCDEGAPGADALVDAGLREGSGNVHAGQGTANRRFFFDNAMLELLWVHDLGEARSEGIARTGLADRFVDRRRGACPFGVCIRAADAHAPLPFATWDYAPPYVPAGTTIPVALGSEQPDQPLVFATPRSGNHTEPVDHRVGFCRLTRVHLRYPSASQPSAAVVALVALGLLECSEGQPRLELGFDAEARGVTIRAAALPLVLRG